MVIDYSKINKIELDPKSAYQIANGITLAFGRSYEDAGDDLFGWSTVRIGDTVGGQKVQAIAVMKTGAGFELLAGGQTYAMTTAANPFDDAKNSIYSDLFWANAGIAGRKLAKDAVQKSRDYRIKNLNSVATGDVGGFYVAGDAAVREFVMKHVGDQAESIAATSGAMVFPEKQSENWLRNRFLQNMSFLTEVFSFPSDLVREVFVSTFIVPKGGSCLLSGVPGTGKSTAPWEPVLVRRNGIIKDTEIGKYVDSVLGPLGAPSDKTDIGLLDNDTEVLTIDANNKIVWRSLTGVSRHKFAGNLIKIKTKSGRMITVTPDHSLVVQKDGELHVSHSDTIHIGDVVPSVSKWSTDLQQIAMVDTILPKSEFIYGSEIHRAIDNNLKFGEFESPICHTNIKNYLKHYSGVPAQGYVCTHNHKGMVIPEHIPLDSNMGYIIGSCLSEGNISSIGPTRKNKQIKITNDNEYFLRRVISSASNLSLSHKRYKYGWRCAYISIHNDALAELLDRTCGCRSDNKKIPDFAFTANTDFVRALLRSYFDGDGYVDICSTDKTPRSISATTKSERLAHGVSMLLSRFGIFANIHTKTIRSGEYAGNVYYNITIPSKYCNIFNEKIGFGIDCKKELAEKIKYRYNSTDMIVNFGNLLERCAIDCDLTTKAPIVNGRQIQITRSSARQRLGQTLAEEYLSIFESINPLSDNVLKLRALVTSNVAWDEITDIEQVPFDGYVYDFEVAGSPTNTFVAGRGGIVVHNTVLTSLAQMVFANSYGFADYEYRPPVQDLVTRKIPDFIFKDMNRRGDVDKGENILTIVPDATRLTPDRVWIALPNSETTSSTTVGMDMRPDAVESFIKEHGSRVDRSDPEAVKVWSEIQALLRAGSVKPGRMMGPLLTQKYSRNRTGKYREDWDDNRFDEAMLRDNRPFGLFETNYYTRSLLRRIRVKDDQGQDAWRYSSDIIYDAATYPDTGERVMWTKEVEAEREFLAKRHEREIIMAELPAAESQPEVKKRLLADLKGIDDLRSNIHKMRDLLDEVSASKSWTGFEIAQGKTKDDIDEMAMDYNSMYNDLVDLISSGMPVYDARGKDAIFDEMKADFGLTTCSENKSPEEILYTTEITLVQDTDPLGRPVQQYDFKPSPMDFVTKPGKFLNEFARANPDFQDQLLSLMDRRLVEHRGERFYSPEFILFLDNNPHKLVTSSIDWALWDRVDIELYLKGANLGTKDVILSGRFGEKKFGDKRSGGSSPDDVFLARLVQSTRTLNSHKASTDFTKSGKLPDDGGLVPLRIRDLHAIWKHVNKVTIPRRVLRYVFLLTATMNQAWYTKVRTVNDTNPPAGGAAKDRLDFPGHEVLGDDFKPYDDKKTTMSDRDMILDYSMLSFAPEFIESSAVVSNTDTSGKALEQLPIGITRPVGIRFVISLLRFSKALAWLRRGKTEVTTDEIDDLFPLAGSHRLNVMPFGEERVAGVDDVIKRVYPSIQDYLKFGVIGKFWSSRKDDYLNYYEDLEVVVNAGYLDVDGCAPSMIGTTSGTCKLKGIHSHNIPNEANDVVILDIQNGVEFVKRSSPEYKKHYNKRTEEITNIGQKNYYGAFLDKASAYITAHDLNGMMPPMLLFKRDADELTRRLERLKDIFATDIAPPTGKPANPHTIALTSPDTVRMAVSSLERFKAYVDTGSANEIKAAITDMTKLSIMYAAIDMISLYDVNARSADIYAMFKKIGISKSQAAIAGTDRSDLIKSVQKKMKDMSFVYGINLTSTGYDVAGKNLHGSLKVSFDGAKPEDCVIRMEATTLNEHFLWRYAVQVDGSLIEYPPLTDADMPA